ncbi:MAG TPA: type II secretion system F family protein [Patescibacteria group bacterium]|nr:type II secretion system F family protein [Patescibacteria group bacterium]
MINDENFQRLVGNLLAEKNSLKELVPLFNSLKSPETSKEEQALILSQIGKINSYVKERNNDIGEILGMISLSKPLKKIKEEIPKKTAPKKVKEKIPKNIGLTKLEKLTIKRLKEKEVKSEKEKIKKPSRYAKTSSRFFGKLSESLLEKDYFSSITKNLTKTNIELTVQSYVSVVLFSTAISFLVSFLIFLFLLVFSVKNFPDITLANMSLLARLPQVFWVMIVIPGAVFAFTYTYPSLERKSEEGKIDQELPFAVIHMATISGALVEPSKIFSIIIATKEYPHLQSQFTKLINFINIYGYDLVNAMRKVALTTPSKKLADLFNSLAVTINSGGSLVQFFNKRAESLLFEYKLDREKYIKFSETFMDIYISAVIAAPMMLMLLLMMIKISGLGLSLSSAMISLIMVLGVSIINITFLVFLHLKQQKEG